MSAATSSLCECGCGRKTPIAKDNDRVKGYVKGQPLRWCQGHATRTKNASGYRMATKPGGGVELAHRRRAELALGKPLPSKAVVHHADGTKSTGAQLVICQDQAYHMLLHFRMRVRAAGGNPNTDKVCGRCHNPKHRDEFDRNAALSDGHLSTCRECRRSVRRAGAAA